MPLAPVLSPSTSAGSLPVKVYIAIVERLSKASAGVAIAMLVASMLVVSHMIFIRYVFRAPTIWHTDFAVFSATASIFLGAPYVLMTKGHVGVDVLEMMVSGRARQLLQLAGAVLGLVFCGAMFWASWLYFYEAYSNSWETSGVWKIPLWVPTLPMPIGFGLLCLQYVAEIMKWGRAE